MPVTLSRSSAPAGESILAWLSEPSLLPSWTLVGPSGIVKLTAGTNPSSGPSSYWDVNYYQSITLPAKLNPGLYSLVNEVGAASPLTVAPAPAKPNYVQLHSAISPVDLAGAVEKQLDKTDVELQPGYYEFNRSVRIPNGRRLRGYGAIVESPSGGAFVCGDDVRLIGLTVQGDGNLFAGGSTLVRLFMNRCVFRGLTSGFGRDLVATDCVWDRCGVVLGGDQLLIRPLFIGTFGGNSCLIRGSRVSLIDPVWRDTDRGPIFQANNGDVSDCLIVHPTMTGLYHTLNGCEGVAAECPPGSKNRFDRNLVFHLRYRGVGPFYQIAGPSASDNVLRDFDVDGGVGLVLDSGDNPVIGTRFMGGEMRGCSVVYLGRKTSGTTFGYLRPGYLESERIEPCRLIDSRATRGNQFPGVAPTNWFPVRDDGAGNDMNGLKAIWSKQLQSEVS